MATTAKKSSAINGGATPKTATSAGATASGGMRQVLQVITKRDGFRRAGREWNGTTTVPLDELTDEQCEQIANEPMLVSLLLEIPTEQVGELAATDDNGSGTGT